jgi:hypothetical protein
MSERLAIEERGGAYRIGWYFYGDENEDEEFGLMLGDHIVSDGIDNRETQAAADAIAASPFRPDYPESLAKRGRAWTWESKSKAQKALAIANAAIKALNAKKPWPDWALKAVAAGWKAPKGWKP